MEKESHRENARNPSQRLSNAAAAAADNSENTPQPVWCVRHSSSQHPASAKQLHYGHTNYGNYTHSRFSRDYKKLKNRQLPGMTKITQLLCREDRIWRKATRLTLHGAYRSLDVDAGKGTKGGAGIRAEGFISCGEMHIISFTHFMCLQFLLHFSFFVLCCWELIPRSYSGYSHSTLELGPRP